LESLNLFFQLFNRLLSLPEGLYQLKPFVEISDASDHDTKENGAENHQEERNLRYFHFEAVDSFEGIPKSNRFPVLHGKMDGEEKSNHPEKGLEIFHGLFTPFRTILFLK
jgi:hypothetical protein